MMLSNAQELRMAQLAEADCRKKSSCNIAHKFIVADLLYRYVRMYESIEILALQQCMLVSCLAPCVSWPDICPWQT